MLIPISTFVHVIESVDIAWKNVILDISDIGASLRNKKSVSVKFYPQTGHTPLLEHTLIVCPLHPALNTVNLRILLYHIYSAHPLPSETSTKLVTYRGQLCDFAELSSDKYFFGHIVGQLKNGQRLYI